MRRPARSPTSSGANVANTTLVAAGVALLVVGGGIAGYGTTRSSTSTSGPVPDAAAMSSAIGQLDGDIKAARAYVQSSAHSISGFQSVRAALSANKETAEDNYKSGALKFDLDPGEVIEIGIIPKDKAVIPFLLQPANAMRSSNAGKAGSYVELMGDH